MIDSCVSECTVTRTVYDGDEVHSSDVKKEYRKCTGEGESDDKKEKTERWMGPED